MSKMSKKIKIGLSLLLAVAIALAFTLGCFIGVRTPPETDLTIVEEAWEIILQDYVDKDNLDTEALAQGAILGMLEALGDPYTAYLDADTYQLSLQDLAGQFEGIGASVTYKDGQIVIVAPIAGMPADKAGIRAGDIIMGIDGQSTEGMSLAEAVLLVQGPAGTAVELLILHEGETEPVLISIVRAVIEVASVSFEMRDEIAYIAISTFSERTAAELAVVMVEVAEQGAEGIILDLRGNLGGPLDATVAVAGFFLEPGMLVVELIDNEGNHELYSVQPGRVASELPLVVLVDGFSASGSEVLAGALQDHGRAVLAGAQTLGKGSVNVLHRLSDGSALYVTVGRWFTPNGRLIEGEGLTPDYELELEDEDLIQWALDYLRGDE
jgi:carboxyl-terminal processing protease